MATFSTSTEKENKMSRNRWMALGSCAAFVVVAACTPVTPLPGTTTPGEATADATAAVTSGGLDGFVADLRDAGSIVEIGAQIQQPYLPIAGTVVRVDSVEVQVFEFADAASRMAVTDSLTQTDATRMPDLPEGINLWAQDRIVVAYLGQDQAVRDTLTAVLGAPLEVSGGWTGLPPEAVLEAQRWLASQLNTTEAQVAIVAVEQAQWPDNCLGLGGPEESCAAVNTPGWRAVFEVNAQRYEVRTDATGSVVRLMTGDASESDLAGTSWELKSAEGSGTTITPIEGSAITLAFGTDGKVSGSGGCNSYGGDYNADAASLSIDAVVPTRRACTNTGIAEQERLYLTALDSVETYQLTASELRLMLNGGVMRFEPAAP